MGKKILIMAVMSVLLLAGCNQESIEERLQRECKEYTNRRCPEEQGNNSILDSMVFDIKTHTLNHYYRLYGVSDNEEAARFKKDELHDLMIEAIKKDTSYKRYKDEGFSFRYIARSDSSGRVIFDETFTKDDYGY